MITVRGKRISTLFSAQEIAERNLDMASRIGETPRNDLLAIAILKGSFIFAADLIRAMHARGLAPEVDFVYEPQESAVSLIASVKVGAFRYVSGQIAKIRPESVALKLPVATIGVRGTSFVAIAEPNLAGCIVLLPSPDGRPSASVVSNEAGEVVIVKDIDSSVEGRDILLIDDILESGNTLKFARELMVKRGARSVEIAVLLDKHSKRKADVNADYVGFDCPAHFVVGYGMDVAYAFRELPFVGVVEGDA